MFSVNNRKITQKQNDATKTMAWTFSPPPPILHHLSIFFLTPSTHVTSQKATNFSSERQTQTHFGTYMKHDKLDHEQMAEEKDKQNI